MSLIDLIKGEERTINGRRFLFTRRDSRHLETGSIGDYIHKHREALLLENIRKRFPDLQHIPKGKMLFFDIETCGLSAESPIATIALGHMFHKQFNIDVDCLVARDYVEEKAILEYFLSILPNYEAFFTYNGSSFDIPRIQARIIQNGLYKLGNTLKRQFNGGHHDLFPLVRQRVDIIDEKLSTLEKTVFQFKRENDVPSAQIPKVYFEYVYGREVVVKERIASPLLWKKALELTRQLGYTGEYEKLPIFHELARERYVRLGGGFRQEYHPGDRLEPQVTEERMSRVIHHNMLDAVTMVGALTYLCAGEKPDHSKYEGSNITPSATSDNSDIPF